MSGANGGVFLVSEGFQAYVGPMLPQKFQTQKEKCWEFMFGHFGALVLNPNRKGFPLGADFGASWAVFRPILGHFRASRRPAGPEFEPRRKESLRLGSHRRPKRGLLGHYLTLCWNTDSILG